MGSAPPVLSFLLMIAAGWVHRHQLIVIEFLQAENRLLKERLRGRRMRFTDAERVGGELPVRRKLVFGTDRGNAAARRDDQARQEQVRMRRRRTIERAVHAMHIVI